MPRAHRYSTSDLDHAELLPTWTTRSHHYGRQIEAMREIRVLSNNIAGAHRERDQLLAALALSQSLSRADMARAAGLSKPRIDQILYEVATENARRQQSEGEERVRRHLPLRSTTRRSPRAGDGNSPQRRALGPIAGRGGPPPPDR